MSEQILDTSPLPGYPEPYGTLLATLQKCTRGWRGQLEVPTREQIGWQPHAGGHSIGAMMLHLAEVETYWIETVALGRQMTQEELQLFLSEQTDPFQGIWPTPPDEEFGYFEAILDRVRANTLEKVKEFGDPTYVKSAEWGSMTLRWILGHLIWHESYHGGQAVLLREIQVRLRDEAAR